MIKKQGRPTKYRSEMCAVLEEMMREGASQIEVMAEIDITEDTFYRWKRKNAIQILEDVRLLEEEQENSQYE